MKMIGGDYFTRCDLPGFFYMPLIRLDQAYIHRTVRVITPDAQFHEERLPLATPLHPRERDQTRL